MKKSVATLALAAALFVAFASPAFASPAFAGRRVAPPIPDITALMRSAAARIHADPRFKHAILLECDGTPESGTITTAHGITQWRIVFSNFAKPQSKFQSVYIDFTAGAFTKPVGVELPFVGSLPLSPSPTMTLNQAVTLLHKAGYTQPFAGVSLFKPVLAKTVEPSYVFTFGLATHIAVGTISKKVHQVD